MVLEGNIRRAGIFVFYDRDGVVDRYAEYLLRDLNQNLEKLVIICNGKLSAIGREKLQKLCDQLYVRENAGLDAAGFQEGILHVFGWDELERYDELVLANDTFYGPFRPFKEIFTEMLSHDVDFWGMTEHLEAAAPGFNISGICPSHLQTYFLVIRSNMVKSREFHEYWERMPVYSDFSQVVKKHETIFTQHFRDRGFRGEAYVDLTGLRGTALSNINCYAFAPGQLVRDHRFCAIKRKNFVLEQSELLVHSGGEELRAALDYVQWNTDYDVGMIWENLLRLYELPLLKQSLHLNYVLPVYSQQKIEHAGVAVLIGCLHEELFSECAAWLAAITEDISVFMLTDTEEKQRVLETLCPGMSIVLCPQMDWWNYVEGYKFVCYLYDAVVISPGIHQITGRSYRYLLQDNLLSSEGYIDNILRTFTENPQLGILAPPMPLHSSYFQQFGRYWADYLPPANQIADELELHHRPGSGAYQPLMIDFSGWYRVEAIRRIAGNVFSDQKALCRIMPLIAQDAGFYTGWVMTDYFASLEIGNLHYISEKLCAVWHNVVPYGTFAQLIAVAGTSQSGMPVIGVRGALKVWIKKRFPRIHKVLLKIFRHY